MSYSIDKTRFRSPSYDERPVGTKIDSIVIHTTEGQFASDAAWLCNPDSRVSAHYVIPPTGSIIYQLVPEARRAWHAGKCMYLGRTDWNSPSLGVEVSHKAGQPWPKGQRDLLAAFCYDLVRHYDIKQQYVVAHRWIATPTGRKSDPTDWSDPQFRDWIADLYVDVSPYMRYRVIAPCAVLTAPNPLAPLAGGPDGGQTRLGVGDIINVGDASEGWLWVSPNTTDPPGIGFLPAAYARPL